MVRLLWPFGGQSWRKLELDRMNFPSTLNAPVCRMALNNLRGLVALTLLSGHIKDVSHGAGLDQDLCGLGDRHISLST